MKHKTEQEAIDAFIKAAGDDFVEFDGQNCNDYLSIDAEECAGWQAGEHRCDCGNRRVYLDVSGNAEAGFVAYAVAN